MMKLSEVVDNLKMLRKNDPGRFQEVINRYKVEEPDFYNQIVPFFPELEKLHPGFEINISPHIEESGFNWDIILIIGVVFVILGGGYFLFTQGFFDTLLTINGEQGGASIVYQNNNQAGGSQVQRPPVSFDTQCYPNNIIISIYITDNRSHTFDYQVSVRKGSTLIFDSGLTTEEPIVRSQSFSVNYPLSSGGFMLGTSLNSGDQYTVTIILDGESSSDTCTCLEG